MKTFLSVNFGCRVNSAELNQLSQKYIDQGYSPTTIYDLPSIILINTCAITKKGEYESISKIKQLQKKFPSAKIIATGCANLSKLKNIQIISKDNLPSFYTPNIKDKFSHTNRYLLKIQTGCTAMCSYCIVPYRRPNLWSLSITDAVKIVNNIPSYKEIIITGVNLNQYTPGLSNLIEALLTKTKIPLISFGSIPLLCIDEKFIKLLENDRLSRFLHIPLQSGSNKILKLMNRNYDVKKIKETFNLLKNVSLGTDVIVGFPGETESDFQETYNLCKEINFSKIHVFRFSPRFETAARKLFLKSPKLTKEIIKQRSMRLRQLSSPTPQSDD